MPRLFDFTGSPEKVALKSLISKSMMIKRKISLFFSPSRTIQLLLTCSNIYVLLFSGSNTLPKEHSELVHLHERCL